jgi:hypothetical protein
MCSLGRIRLTGKGKAMNQTPTIKTSSVKVVRDIRAFPWQSYVLPSDGRKARHVAEQRRALAIQLATHADGDGTSITVGRNKLARDIGWPVKTIGRRLRELKQIGPGFLSNDGLEAEHGNAKRKLDISKLKMPIAGGPDSPSERPNSAEQEGQIHKAGRPDSTNVGEQEGHIGGAGRPDTIGPQPSFTEVKETDPPTDHKKRLEGFLSKNKPAAMAEPRDEIKTKLEKLLIEQGEEVMATVFWKFENRTEGFAGVKHPWLLLLKDFTRLLTEVTNEMAAEKHRQYIQRLSEEQAVKAARMMARNKGQIDWEKLRDPTHIEPPLEYGEGLNQEQEMTIEEMLGEVPADAQPVAVCR